jgi:hypothetical protein
MGFALRDNAICKRDEMPCLHFAKACDRDKTEINFSQFFLLALLPPGIIV